MITGIDTPDMAYKDTHTHTHTQLWLWLEILIFEFWILFSLFICYISISTPNIIAVFRSLQLQ